MCDATRCVPSSTGAGTGAESLACFAEVPADARFDERSRRSSKQRQFGSARVGIEVSRRVAEDLGLTETALRDWVKRADIDAGKGPLEALTTAEREEMARLRRENKRLAMCATF